MKKPSEAEGQVFGRIERVGKGLAARGGKGSGILIQTAKRGGRNACQMAFFVCMLLHLSQPAEAASGSVPSPAAILSSGEPALGRKHNAAFAIKRPKPGRIWSGPQEAWCLLPHRHGASEAAPTESTESTESTEAPVPPTEPRPPQPEAFFPPPSLSPLLLFLITLPTLEEVTAYFAEALGETPVIEGQQRLRFERWLVFKWGSSWRRCVLSGATTAGAGVTLDWWTNDDFGLSELREFFEAPFFRQCESLRFYQWLGEGGAHEGDFRGHRIRMAVRRHDGVLFVRIQWWRPAPEAESSDTPVELETPDPTSTPLALFQKTTPPRGRPSSMRPASMGFNPSDSPETGPAPLPVQPARLALRPPQPTEGVRNTAHGRYATPGLYR